MELSLVLISSLCAGLIMVVGLLFKSLGAQNREILSKLRAVEMSITALREHKSRAEEKFDTVSERFVLMDDRLKRIEDREVLS